MSLAEPSRVRMLFDDGVCEEVTVSFVGECLCRLEETPMASTTDARLGDVVEFEPEDGIAKMRRVAERSPLEMLVWAISDELLASDDFQRLAAMIEGKGGVIERAHGGSLLVHVRPDERDAAERQYASLLA